MKRLLGILLVLGVMCGATFFFWAPAKVKTGKPVTRERLPIGSLR